MTDYQDKYDKLMLEFTFFKEKARSRDYKRGIAAIAKIDKKLEIEKDICMVESLVDEAKYWAEHIEMTPQTEIGIKIRHSNAAALKKMADS